MLMNQTQEEREGVGDVKSDSSFLDYQSANEIFQVISKTYDGNETDSQIITSQDLVILYENSDLETKMYSYPDQKARRTNQYVETIIYNDDQDSESSDTSEIYTKEDFSDLCTINNEAINLINSIPCFENSLRHKHGNIKLKTSQYSSDYNKQFVFRDPYINDQLNSTDIFNSMLTSSLIDYVCCKRIDDDYNFYMDSLITYVQHTIEQLKRISNGDYLTDLAREKWRGASVEKKFNKQNKELATSSSIPLSVNSSNISQKTIWEVAVHSEMNLKFFNKVLEKKIILEIPRLICGSFTLFGKRCNDKLIIHCTKDKNKINKNDDEKTSQLTVALEFCSKSPLHNRSSTLVWQTTSSTNLSEKSENNLIGIEYFNHDLQTNNEESNIKIVELEDQSFTCNEDQSFTCTKECSNEIIKTEDVHDVNLDNGDAFNVQVTEEFCVEDKNPNIPITNGDTLASAIQRLNSQSPVLEETDNNQKKKRSPTRIRLKSPYENKSHILDEKKRKKLLEIRERREKKKIAMSKNCKIVKNKYGAIMAQASSSVTKLSITNKSFYNSIYGQAISIDNRIVKKSTIEKKGASEFNEVERVDTNENNILIQIPQLEIIAIPSNALINNSDVSLSLHESLVELEKMDDNENNLDPSSSLTNLVPTNTPNKEKGSEWSSKSTLSVECRKSIDKLYDLMKLLVKDENVEFEKTKSFSTSDDTFNMQDSIKLQSCDSNRSYSSLEKIVSETTNSTANMHNLNNETDTNPKEFVTPKAQTVTFDEKSIKKDHKLEKAADNPLKAISQLLHKFENVQKGNHKSTKEVKANKKLEGLDNKTNVRHSMSPKYPKSERYIGNNNVEDSRVSTPKDKKRNVISSAKDTVKASNQYKSLDHKVEKIDKKKVAELIDEVKEMRGEAVRGPRHYSRLESLAQPKKLRIDTSNNDYRSGKHGKSFSNDRQNKHASSLSVRNYNVPLPKLKEKNISTTNTRLKGNMLPSEGGSSRRHSANKSPERKRSPERNHPSPVKLNSMPEGLKTDDHYKKKKNMAFDTYAKNPVRQASPTFDSKPVKKSRLPLIPADMDWGSLTSSTSAEEATSLGNTLHNMINAIINISPPTLKPLAECDESLSRLSNINPSDTCIETLSKPGVVLSGSDFLIDIFGDKNIVTAVANTSNSKNVNVHFSDMNEEEILNNSERSTSSLTELEKLEKALNGRVTSDTFRNKLRIKNLTPKQSMQQILLLQSGDTGSVVVKSTLSQKINTSKSEFTPNVHKVQSLSNNNIDCSNKKLPLLCYPVLQSTQLKIKSKVSLNDLTSQNLSQIDKKKEICFDENKTVIEKKVDADDEGTVTVNNVKFNGKVTKTDDHNMDTSTGDIGTIATSNEIKNVNDTTSMDILVGLLNEIKKISTLQSDIKIEKYSNDVNLKDRQSSHYPKCHNEVSMTSFNKLRKLDSSPSLYYMSSNDELRDVKSLFIKPHLGNVNKGFNFTSIPVDKEVTANVTESLYFVHRYTEAPPQIFNKLNKYTSVTNSIVELKDPMSSQLMNTKDNYKVIHTNSSIFEEKIERVEKLPCDGNIENNYISIRRTNLKENHLANLKSDYEPHLKMKRDLLVTLYSILVLIVFAALSFPGILLHMLQHA